MPETIEQVLTKLTALVQPGLRGRLNARGTARAMVWRNGNLPEGSPNLGPFLTQELLSYGFGLLRVALRARNLGGNDETILRAFELAAESLESVVRNGSPEDESRGFYRVVAAASYHLGRFSARSYSLLAQTLENENQSVIERALSLLILRRLDEVYAILLRHTSDPDYSDAAIAQRLDNPDDPADVADALSISATENYLRAIAAFLFALRADDETVLASCRERLTDGEQLCFESGLVALWWIYRLTRFLTDDLWSLSLQRLLPKDSDDTSNWMLLRELFVASLAGRSTAELDLWPSQLPIASRALDTHDNIVASLPTSAGKTRIAEICILRTLSLNRRVVFVTPLRALSAQTERTLRRTFQPIGFDVSALYGSAGTSAFDLDSLANREIVVTTPEKLDFALRNDSSLLDDVGLIVLDEGHMLGPTEREVRYEVLIQRLLRRSDASERRIVCLSAMLPSGEQMDDFVKWLRSDAPGDPITSTWRPTRQRYGEIVWDGAKARYELKIDDQTNTFIPRFIERQEKIGKRGGKKIFPGDLNDVVLASAWRLAADRHSVLVYCPERRSVNALAKRLLKIRKEGFLGDLPGFSANAVKNAISVGEEWLGSEHPAVKCLSLGVAIHHASLPKPFLRKIDGLLRDKLVQVVVASPTLARGLNISASCVLFQSVQRFDQTKNKRLLISPEEFANVSGRAGRAYVDVDGQVIGVCFTAEHLYKWRTLASQEAKRQLESGLIGIMSPLFRGLQRKLGRSENLVEYVMNSSSIWDEPPGKEEETKEWQNALSTLDIALLSLLGDEECKPDEVADVLDKILESSFLRRRLLRRNELAQSFVPAVLTARAKHICSTTTTKQRRGYFFSGVGLSSGRFLDENSNQLNQALLAADEAILSGDSAGCIASLLVIARLVFAIEPFTPHTLPETWEAIFSGWLLGLPMAQLQVIDEDAPTFIEDGVVYRLAWAVEAIRVRSRANDELVFGEKPSTVVGALETGTVSVPQSLLLQAGLSSRIAAAKALEDCPVHFETLLQMRTWLFSDLVNHATSQADWPTSESRTAWLEFIDSQRRMEGTRWMAQDVTWELETSVAPQREGDSVLVWQTNPAETARIFTPDLFEIGRALTAFQTWATPWAVGRIVGTNAVSSRYTGPFPIKHDH